jgi:hypothetical protein
VYALVLYIQYCITVLTLFRLYIHIIRKYRTIGSIGPPTPPISPFIRRSTVFHVGNMTSNVAGSCILKQVSTTDLYQAKWFQWQRLSFNSGSTPFEYQAGHRLSSLRFAVVFLNISRKMPKSLKLRPPSSTHIPPDSLLTFIPSSDAI